MSQLRTTIGNERELMGMEDFDAKEKKIDLPFNKKLKVKKQNLLLANTDTDMEQTTITIKPKRQYIRKPKALVVEEATDQQESDEEEETPPTDPADLMNDGIDTSQEEQAYAEGVEAEEEEDDEEEVAEPVADDADSVVSEETYLKNRLAEIQLKKKKDTARRNIVNIRELENINIQKQITYHEVRLAILRAEAKRVQDGDDDERLLDYVIHSAPKAKGEKGEKTEPTYEGRGKKAGTGDAREKIVANLNGGKTEKVKYAKKVGTNTWSLMYEERQDGGIVVMKDSKGAYIIPILKEVGAMIGVSIKTKQEYIDWVKTA